MKEIWDHSMMLLLNMTITDEEYKLLVMEAGGRMAATGKWLATTTLAYELLKPQIAKLNGGPPPQDNKQDAEQEDNLLTQAFDDLDV